MAETSPSSEQSAPPIRWKSSLDPSCLSRFELIGKGAFALVYKALLRHAPSNLPPGTNRSPASTSLPVSPSRRARAIEVAVKVFRPSLRGQPSSLRQFLTEAHLHLKTSDGHPSIVKLLGTVSLPLSSLVPMTPPSLLLPQGSPIALAAAELHSSSNTMSEDQKARMHQALARYCSGQVCWALVLEYCSGGSLFDQLSHQISPQGTEHLYSMKDAVKWLQEIASGLSYLHSQSPMIIHRDLKLENLLLTTTSQPSTSNSPNNRSQVRICDLGLASEVDLNRGRKVARKDILHPPLLSFRYLARSLIKKELAGVAKSIGAASTNALPSSFTSIRRRGNRCPSFSGSQGREFGQQERHRENQGVIRRALSLDFNSTSQPTGSVQCLFSRQRNQSPSPSHLLYLPDLHAPTFDLTGLVGSIMYLAPEVARGKPYNERCDVFSFGMIMWELTSRKLLSNTFLASKDEEGTAEYLKKVAWEGWRPEPPSWLPSDYQLLIKLCVHQDPRARPTSTTLASVLSCSALLDAALAKDLIDHAPRFSPNFNPLFQETLDAPTLVIPEPTPTRTTVESMPQPLFRPPPVSYSPSKKPHDQSKSKPINKKDLPSEAVCCPIS